MSQEYTRSLHPRINEARRCAECGQPFRAHHAERTVCRTCMDAIDRPDADWDPSWSVGVRALNFALVHLEDTHGL